MVKQEPELTQAEATGPITKATFWRRASLYVRTNQIDPVVVTAGTPECEAWHQYFVRRLGWVPWAMRAVIDGDREALTLPTAQPTWFDLSFSEDPEWREPPVRKRGSDLPPPAAVNLFVCDAAPQYADVVAIHEASERSPARYETRICDDGVTRRGIWVPLAWLPEKRRRSSFQLPRPKTPPPADDFIPFDSEAA